MIDTSRLQVIGDLWRDIHNNWAKKNRFEYVVVPSEDIRGKPLDEVKQMSFKVGVTEQNTTTLSVQELTAFFVLVKDQARQFGEMAAARKGGQALPAETSLNVIIPLAPSDEEIKSVLSSIQFTVHLDEATATANETATSVEAAKDTFGLTQERVDLVLALVKKKANAALSGTKGNHFWVYPPQIFLDRPSAISEPEAYERFKDTVWWVRWPDGQFNQLRFIELLIFVHQIIVSKAAFEQAGKAVSERHPSSHRQSKHAGGWQPKKDRDRKPRKNDDWVKINVRGGFAPSELAKDQMIRGLFSKVTVAKTLRPNEAMN
jgi:hypothetical protein